MTIQMSDSQGRTGHGRPGTAELSARLEPFDSYWQAPEDLEKGYGRFNQYYRYNFLPHLPVERDKRILVVSCGPGYLVQLLVDQGYVGVVGIDSDPEKVRYAVERGLDCRVERAFDSLAKASVSYDVIVCEQELNHLTKEEIVEFLGLCRRSLATGGVLLVYGLNGANPITGAEALAQNLDHFNTFTEYSLRQVLELTGFEEVDVFPLKLYVFYRNPLNYLGILLTATLELFFAVCFRLYGKSNRIFSKKIAAVGRKTDPAA